MDFMNQTTLFLELFHVFNPYDCDKLVHSQCENIYCIFLVEIFDRTSQLRMCPENKVHEFTPGNIQF